MAAMPPGVIPLPLQPRMAAELHGINLLRGGWNATGCNLLINSFVQRWNIPTQAAFDALYQYHVDIERQPRWVPSITYPPPAPQGVNGDANKVIQVQADQAEILRRYDDNDLRFLIEFPPGHRNIPEEYREGGAELLITIPLSGSSAFTIYCVQFLESIPCVKYSYPVIHYFSVALFNTTASHCLRRKIPLVHFSSSCHYRIGRYGELRLITIDEALLNLRQPALSNDIINRSNFDNNGVHGSQQRYDIMAIRQNAQMLSPPTGIALDSPAYQSQQINKDRCPGVDQLIQLIGQVRYDKLDKYCREQLGWVGGLGAYLMNHKGQIVIVPGDMVSNSGMTLHPHHLNKQFRKAGEQETNKWRAVWIRFRNSTLVRRARALRTAANTIRQHIRSPAYQAEEASNSGHHAYASCNLLRGNVFQLTHIDRREVNLPSNSNNLPSPHNDHGNSFVTHVIATHDSDMVHAVGLDTHNTPGNSHLVRWDVPVVSIGSFHTSVGPASSPILGSLTTDMEDHYRPSLNPLKYRYAPATQGEDIDGGDLSAALSRMTPPNFFKIVASGVASGLLYLHKKKILHRDVKPGNVLLSGDLRGTFTAKLTDFGLAAMLQNNASINNGRGGDLTAETGTYRYMAPEVIKHERYQYSADIYSLSMLMWEIITREAPFKTLSQIEAAGSVALEGKRPPFPNGIPSYVKSMIEKCWTEKPDQRMSVEELIKTLEEMELNLTEDSKSWLDAPNGHPVYDRLEEEDIQAKETKKKPKPKRTSLFKKLSKT